MTFLGLLLSVLAGATAGLLGGGGSILMVPLLVYALGLAPKSAIATSLLAVGLMSAVGVLVHARAGRVLWRSGAFFGAAGMAGAYLGGQAARFVPGGALLLLFGAMMLVAALAMMRDRAPAAVAAPSGRPELPLSRIVPIGVLVGTFAGLVGAGGGFLIVPALVLLGGVAMTAAVGTSLLVIAMQSLAGFAGHLGHDPIDWTLAAAVTIAAALGTLLGGRLAGRIPQSALRRIFSWFVLAMGVFMVSRQLPHGP